MGISFYIFVIAKFELLTYHYPNRLLVTIDFVTRHAQSYFSLFIHIMYAIYLVMMIQWHLACTMFYKHHKSLFNFDEDWFYKTTKCQM